MSRRQHFDPADLGSVARRLDEVLSAHGAEDVLAESLRLIVGRRTAELTRASFRPQAAATLNDWIVRANLAWPGLDLQPTRLPDAAVADAAEVLADVSLGGQQHEGLDAVFQAVVSRTARGEKGQFFTPRPIVQDVLARLDPRPGEQIADPACGSGGFLSGARQRQPSCSVWGFDNDARALSVAHVLLAMSGGGTVRHLDSLQLGALEAAMGPGFAGFDVILTNPPFAGDVGPRPDYQLAQGHRVERDVLFLERCIRLLRPGGRFGIIVPDKQVSADRLGFVRRWLLENAEITGVVGLPRDAFMPYTSQRACVLIGHKRASARVPGPDEIVTFFAPGERARGSPSARIGGPAERTIAQLESPWVLSPERYGAAKATPGVRLGELVEVRTEVHRPERLPAGRPILVLDTSHAQEGFVTARHALISGEAVGSPKQVLGPGDVVISRLRSYLRQVGFVDPSLFTHADGGNVVLGSAEFVTLRTRGAFPAAALVPLLLSPDVQALLAASQEGGHHPRFRAALIESLVVPQAVIADAPRIAATVARAAALRRQADQLMASVQAQA